MIGLITSFGLILLIIPLVRMKHDSSSLLDAMGPLQVAWLAARTKSSADLEALSSVYPPTTENLRREGVFELLHNGPREMKED